MRRARWALAIAFAAVLIAGCTSDDSSGPSSVPSVATGEASGEIIVSAAASLTEAFTQVGVGFERANPDATVTFNFGASAALATQIEQGAPADTFASADEANMGKLVSAGVIDGAPVVFAKNRLVIVTKIGNPKHVKTLADLANLGVISLCGETVPCGKYAAQILQSAGVTIPETRITRGEDVKTTLAAVTTGDADAAIVYLSDASSAPVTEVAIPAAVNAIATYPIARLKRSENPATSRAFIDYVMSPEGQMVLRSFRFLPGP